MRTCRRGFSRRPRRGSWRGRTGDGLVVCVVRLVMIKAAKVRYGNLWVRLVFGCYCRYGRSFKLG